MRSKPRLLTAIWFGATGLVPSLLWFLPGIVKRNLFSGLHLWTFFLFPGIAAAVSGFLVGPALLDPERVRSIGRAFLQGALVAVFSVVLYAPMSAAYGALTGAEGGTGSFFSLTIMILSFCLVVCGWAIALIGGLSGAVLYKLSRRKEQ